MDVVGAGSFAAKKEETTLEFKLMGGFWAPGDYVGVQRTFVYVNELLTLDRYLIIQPTENWEICNWAQHFSPASIERELEGAGFEVDQMAGDLSGAPLGPESDLIGVVARKA